MLIIRLSIRYSLVALYLLLALTLHLPLLLVRFVLFCAMKLIDTLLLPVRKAILFLWQSAAQLAMALCRAGKRVAVLDVDLCGNR